MAKSNIKQTFYALLLLTCLFITGCGTSADSAPETEVFWSSDPDTASSSLSETTAPTDSETDQLPPAAEESEAFDLPPMVMVNDILYQFSGSLSDDALRCGMMDGQITSEVDGSEIPFENNQSNFGTGYGYQYAAENGLEIYMPYGNPDEMHWLQFEPKNSGIQNTILLTSAPALCLTDPLSSQINSFEIRSGNYSWNYQDGEEMCSLIACGVHPLDAALNAQDITLKLPHYQNQDTVTYTYSCEVSPDRMIIRKWNSSDIGSTDAQEVSVTTLESPSSLVELEPGFVYEFTLEWKEENLERNGFYGNASYAFITE